MRPVAHHPSAIPSSGDQTTTSRGRPRKGSPRRAKPIKVTVELPAPLHRDLVAYADYLNSPVVSPAIGAAYAKATVTFSCPRRARCSLRE
ncbi:DUF2274 domain-containing protein [Mesorhizobium sp. M1E.F.Ca.ET.063.01.1.1]|uniref:DUF2274 domain-containing protein n=1 Tax=Mesorhizobium sp. M1E.F.Ca.ET.063.01.1.1 TaxID=2496750 RepID=UPI002479FC45|nr:DUF2274 domain-containing protein [Mesorhizobium sp. M1E.F.Ca.ET.063.01.1.1]